MKQKKSAVEKFDPLRRRAERLMANPDFIKSPVEFEEQLQLIHELQTFQIELDLQNVELHRSQQELMEFKIQYSQLYDLAPVGYVSLNLKGVILNANLTLAQMLSMERNVLIHQPFSNCILSEDQDIYYLHMKKMSESKTQLVCELRMEKKDNTPIDVQLESSIIQDKSGNPLEYRIAVIDVTERKLNAIVLRYGRHQLERVLNNIKSFIYIADMKSHGILFINKHMKHFFEKNMTGDIYWRAIHENRAGPSDFCSMNRLVDADGNPMEPYIREFNNKGQDRWYELSSLAIPWIDGRLVRLEIAKEITDRKNLENRQKEINIILEDKVKERTAELKDMNTALKVLLEKREEDHTEVGEKIFLNHKLLLSPIIGTLKKVLTKNNQKDMIEILELGLKNILSPFSKKLSDPMVNLTPTEIHVADLVRYGKSNKEISEILNSSAHTISRHRENIRKKLGLKNKKINLQSFLSSL